MWQAALSILLIAYIPGALTLRLPYGRRSLRAALPAEERLFWSITISVTLSSIVAFALAAGGAYRFDRLLWIEGGLTCAAALVGRRHLRWHGSAPSPGWTALLPGALVLAGLLLFFSAPPAEWIAGGRDPGVYMNEGIQISQRGSLVVIDPTVTALPTRFQSLFFPPRPSHEWGYEKRRFLSFYILDTTAGTVVGQFPHLYPTWIAIGYDLNGITGARYVSGLWALLGVLAVYFAGVWLVGRAAGFAGALLLTVHVSQVWFASQPSAELILQTLVFAGLLAYARAHVDEDRFFAPVSGVMLGLGIFAHLAGAFVAVAVVGATLFGRSAGQRWLWSFVLPLVAAVVLYITYLFTILLPYAAQPLRFVLGLRATQVALLALGGSGGLALAWAAGRPAIAATIRRWLPIVTGATVCVAAGYALFFRQAGGLLAPHDAETLRTFTRFYLLPVGMAAALLGWVLVVSQSFWRGLAFVLSTALLAIFFFYKGRIVPEHFWWSRRYLPLILPACLLLVGTTAFGELRAAWMPDWSRHRTVAYMRYGLGFVLVCFLGYQYLQATRPILDHVEYAGLVPRMEALAGQIGDNDLVLVESRAVSDLHVLAVPLNFIYARQTLLFDRGTPDKLLLLDFLEWARTRYDRTLFMGGGGMDLLTRRTAFSMIASDRFEIPEYDRPLNAYPTEVRQKAFDYGLYELRPATGDAVGMDLDVGLEDRLEVQRFYAPEQTPEDVTYRWSRDRSQVMMFGTIPEGAEVVLHLADGERPAAAGAASVTVSLNDTPLGTATVAGGFLPYRFAISEGLADTINRSIDPGRLEIESTTWTPQQQSGGPDTRELGVMVDRVQIR
jgi:hypothetical protein